MTATAAEFDALTIDRIVERAGTLYTLPAVAAEVIELTNDHHVDSASLKACIERDPALAVKLLRVVNSSLFGLSGQVGDLNQALAILGVKPLKLLVLGFTLPDTLFLDVARSQLIWYWQTTLSRAVAAREISEQLFDQQGDDAFLAGLLQDIGVLVMLGQIGKPYADVLAEVIAERNDIRRVEIDALGFDHTELTARLLQSWNMPQRLVRAIAEPQQALRLGKSQEDHAPLARTLHLAELLSQLVAQRRLLVLPDLLEAGSLYADLDKEGLEGLIRALDPKVRQLADVLAVPGSPETAFLEVLTEAHRQLSDLADPLAGQLCRQDACLGQLSEARSEDAPAPRSAAVASAEASPTPVERRVPPVTNVQLAYTSSDALVERLADASHDPRRAMRIGGSDDAVTRRLTLAVGVARSNRTSISVAVVGIEGEQSLDAADEKTAWQLLRSACLRELESEQCLFELAPTRMMLVLVGSERKEAVALASGIIDQVRTVASQLNAANKLPRCIAAAGVASADSPPKNFPPRNLETTASRCFTAALSGGGATVKSLEVS